MRSLAALWLASLAGCFFDHAGLEPRGDEPDAAVDAPVADAGPDGETPDVAVIDARPDAEVIDATPDACVPLAMELCNGVDDTCEGAIDEGLGLGTPCDGPDTDLCADDARMCDASGIGTVCGNTSPDDDVEVCNGGDDDCDSMIDEGFALGVLCDGADGDSCDEGLTVCDGFGGLGCSDATGTTVEICNSLDDDCNGVPDDADVSSDEANCGACFNACTNGNGTTECLGGVCTPICVGSNDCDGDPDNGCELLRDTNPGCPSVSSGTVRGDFSTDVLLFTGSTEQYYAFNISEVNGADINPHASIVLVSPPGVNFDLYVQCTSCFGASTLSSTNGPGMTDLIDVASMDVNAMNNAFQIRVEVRYAGATACGDWSLSITGNLGATLVTCPSG